MSQSCKLFAPLGAASFRAHVRRKVRFLPALAVCLTVAGPPDPAFAQSDDSSSVRIERMKFLNAKAGRIYAKMTTAQEHGDNASYNREKRRYEKVQRRLKKTPQVVKPTPNTDSTRKTKRTIDDTGVKTSIYVHTAKKTYSIYDNGWSYPADAATFPPSESMTKRQKQYYDAKVTKSKWDLEVGNQNKLPYVFGDLSSLGNKERGDVVRALKWQYERDHPANLNDLVSKRAQGAVINTQDHYDSRQIEWTPEGRLRKQKEKELKDRLDAWRLTRPKFW